LNHGSFGTAPLYVLEKQRELTERMETRPDIWFRAGIKLFYTQKKKNQNFHQN